MKTRGGQKGGGGVSPRETTRENKVEEGKQDGEAERTFLHYRHVRGLITGTRGVIFSPSSSRRFAAFFFGLGATPRRRLTLC